MSIPPTKSSNNKKIASPFSLRLTFDERSALEQEAGHLPLGAYIRSRLFGGSEAPRKVRTRPRKPIKDDRTMASLLGALGQSRIANNLNQLAKAANMGSLPVTPDTEKAINEACSAVQDMRRQLMQALGFPHSGGPP
ncbi:MAG: plasmid mobilization relaxosome protein MobC [Candidatus Thiodiazotropha sp.]